MGNVGQKMHQKNNDNNKSKNSSNSKEIFKFVEKDIKTLTPRRQLPKLLLLNLSAKILKQRKYLMHNLIFVRQNYL